MLLLQLCVARSGAMLPWGTFLGVRSINPNHDASECLGKNMERFGLGLECFFNIKHHIS